ncbi:MAG: alpha/beta fold hydrolase [Gemmatimonadota bacterium]|nr:alpha/beta fold hydrolase [Gemmatimonadota bacterium]MDH4349884.1 alpha/beta fold hydrolase [Gemmatimonadota bacterium]MDH5198072.1 alpha/beta fold hydrolase [Gemmatimonadota bacterium]
MMKQRLATQVLALALAPVAMVPLACATAQVTIEEITFTSEAFTIVGDLRLPAGAGPHPVVLFVHGDGPNSRTSGVTYPPLMERMHRTGYATFAWDKPGTGESTGEFDGGRLLDQRAQIVLDAVAVMRARPDIDAGRIGLWGISQAGYVMPRVLERTDDVAFMIAIGCPGEPGVDQGAYLVTAQARCTGGLTDQEAETMEFLLGAVERAETYPEYVAHKTALRAIPAFMALEGQGVFVGVQPEERWHEPNLAGDYFLDPMAAVARTDIPVLAVFGERDTQADPIQGVAAYRAALEHGNHPLSRVELIPGTDHNILLSETGCIAERDRRSRSGWRNYPEQYLSLIEEWLTQVRRAW